MYMYIYMHTHTHTHKHTHTHIHTHTQEEAGPAAPPTDMELRKSATGPQQQQGTDSTDGAPLMTGAPPSIGVTANKYSRQVSTAVRGRDL